MQCESFNNQARESALSSRGSRTPVTGKNPFVSCFLQDYSRDVRQELDNHSGWIERIEPTVYGKDDVG